MRLLLAWVEGEGERRQRKVPLPPVVGDSVVGGWFELGSFVLLGTLAAGVFACWLCKAHTQGQRETVIARLASRGLGASAAITLADARVEWVARIEAGRGPTTGFMVIRRQGLVILCEFSLVTIPEEIRVGDTITIRAYDRAGEETGWLLLKNCEVVQRF